MDSGFATALQLIGTVAPRGVSPVVIGSNNGLGYHKAKMGIEDVYTGPGCLNVRRHSKGLPGNILKLTAEQER